MAGRLAGNGLGPKAGCFGRCSFDKLPCARITSIRFKGTFSVEGLTAFNTPSECAAGLRRGVHSRSRRSPLRGHGIRLRWDPAERRASHCAGGPQNAWHLPVGATPSSRKASQTTTHRPEGGAPTKCGAFHGVWLLQNAGCPTALGSHKMRGVPLRWGINKMRGVSL